MAGRTLGVLMWKHLMVRRRRFIHTIVELASTIVFFVLIFSFKSHLKPPIPKASLAGLYDYKIQIPDVIPLNMLHIPQRVVYYPENDKTRMLMDEVGRKLGLRRQSYLPDHTRIKNFMSYYGAYNKSEVAVFLKEMFKDEAYVEFENVNGDDWPATLKYTIRVKKIFHTDTIEPMDGLPRPHSGFGEDYNEFVHLQWVIDTAYIKLVTNNDIKQDISFQEFPYYGSNNDVMMTLICNISFILCIMSLFLMFVFLMVRLMEERATGVQELIKMVGVSPNTLGISHFLNVLHVGLVYSIVITVLMKVTSNPLIPNSDGFMMFIVLLLHFISTVALAFACSYLATSVQYTISLSVFAFVLMTLPVIVIKSLVSVPRFVVLLVGIFPHVPLFWYWSEVLAFESFDYGLQWSDSMTSHSSTSGPVLLGIAWMVVQIILFFTLAWYLSLVRPGKYGTPLPWTFLFQKSYWTKNEVNPESEADEEELIDREEKYFEKPPTNLEVGIKIENLSKVFPKHKALSNINLEVYKGEITVLLGHNGAGKTTLMSIITGMLNATEGKVYVNGEDTQRYKDRVRKQIGLCPQHNLFFPDLTVLEHAMFFALLKSGTYREVRNSSLQLLDRLGLGGKADVHSSSLSGGMKRRLQLACALAGGAELLVLDEPTAGLDVETRRELWDLLLSLRESSCVLLSTHFMEEAEALGDRVAALHLGRLRCHATTMHLKKAIGTGYRLSLTTSCLPREQAITSAVTSHVSDATLTQSTINSVTYNLPAAACANFPQLFTSLEDRKAELAIESIGVGVSTLEEVFLKLCSDTDTNVMEDEVDNSRIEPTFNKITGAHLYVRQFYVLLKRQALFIWSKKLAFILLQLLIPILMIFQFTSVFNTYKSDLDINQKIATNLDLYSSRLSNKVMYNIDAPGADIEILKRDYPKVNFVKQGDIAEDILNIGKQDIMEYHKYLIGIELNETHAKVLYTTLVRHAAPTALNMLSNLLATQFMAGADGHTITSSNQPVSGRVERVDNSVVEPKPLELCILWGVFVVFIILSTLANLSALPCRERESGTRHIHIMCGCPAVLHWTATLLFHVALTTTTLVVATAVAVATLDTDNTIDNSQAIMSIVLLLVCGSFSFLSFMYLVSFSFGERGTGAVIVGVLIVFGLVTPSVQTALYFVTSDHEFLSFLLTLSSIVTPPHALTVGLAHVLNVARLNAYCDLNKDKCPMFVVPSDGFDLEKCCGGENPRCYFCWDKYSAAKELIHLIIQTFVYMTLVVLVECGWWSCIWERIMNVRYTGHLRSQTHFDDIVRAERVFVDKEITLDKRQIESANVSMLVNNLHKNYKGIIKSCNAVKGVSFSVKKGECFGLLGVNGAGKSTTFKMLTGEECPTKGNIYGNGYFIDKERGKYLNTLGYCPQFFGLDDFLCGRDNLALLLTLRGLDAADVDNEVKSWINIVGLEKYSGRCVSGYSGGMCRRLGAAAALGVGARAALLDEPTAGVDVAARRRVWAALRRSQAQGRSVLITSHSMDEMEALCSRIGIMSGGVVRALGTPHELRASHALGHAVTLKLRNRAHGDASDVVDSPKNDVESLKSSLHNKFNCTLKDQHKTMLHYHINETLRYSDLFSTLEQLKATYPTLLEDYSVTETTLEEVFLSIARENKQNENGTNHVV